jgi:hypothetical protein
MWKELHESIKCINSELDHKKCCFPESAKRLLAASLLMTPKLSGARAELIMHATARSLLDTLNLPYTGDNILNIMPCKKTMEGYIQDLACSVLFNCSVQLDEECGVGAYFASDKADEKVKKGMQNASQNGRQHLLWKIFLMDRSTVVCSTLMEQEPPRKRVPMVLQTH